MQQVAIPPCVAANSSAPSSSLGSYGTSVAPGSNCGIEPVKYFSKDVQHVMQEKVLTALDVVVKPTHSLDIQDCQVKNIDQAGSVAASPCGAVNSSAILSSRGSIGTPIVSGSNGGT